MEAKISNVMEIDTVKLRERLVIRGDMVGRLGEMEVFPLGDSSEGNSKESKNANEHQENTEGKKWKKMYLKGSNGSWCQKQLRDPRDADCKLSTRFDQKVNWEISQMQCLCRDGVS